MTVIGYLDDKKKRPDRTPDVIAKFLIFLAELSEKKHNFWLAFMYILYNDVTNVVRKGKCKDDRGTRYNLMKCIISPWGLSWERVFNKHKCIQFIA